MGDVRRAVIPRFWMEGWPRGAEGDARPGGPGPVMNDRGRGRPSRREVVAGLLLELWDPIGVAPDGSVVRDEYERYVGAVLALLERQVPPATLAARLGDLERDELGLAPDGDRLMQVAAALLERWTQMPDLETRDARRCVGRRRRS